MRARREYARRWKRVWCWIVGHDKGMYFVNQPGTEGEFREICVRCGKR